MCDSEQMSTFAKLSNIPLISTDPDVGQNLAAWRAYIL